MHLRFLLRWSGVRQQLRYLKSNLKKGQVVAHLGIFLTESVEICAVQHVGRRDVSVLYFTFRTYAT